MRTLAALALISVLGLGACAKQEAPKPVAPHEYELFSNVTHYLGTHVDARSAPPGGGWMDVGNDFHVWTVPDVVFRDAGCVKETPCEANVTLFDANGDYRWNGLRAGDTMRVRLTQEYGRPDALDLTFDHVGAPTEDIDQILLGDKGTLDFSFGLFDSILDAYASND